MTHQPPPAYGPESAYHRNHQNADKRKHKRRNKIRTTTTSFTVPLLAADNYHDEQPQDLLRQYGQTTSSLTSATAPHNRELGPSFSPTRSTEEHHHHDLITTTQSMRLEPSLEGPLKPPMLNHHVVNTTRRLQHKTKQPIATHTITNNNNNNNSNNKTTNRVCSTSTAIQVHHEKQYRQFCGLHCINNLLQLDPGAKIEIEHLDQLADEMHRREQELFCVVETETTSKKDRKSEYGSIDDCARHCGNGSSNDSESHVITVDDDVMIVCEEECTKKENSKDDDEDDEGGDDDGYSWFSCLLSPFGSCTRGRNKKQKKPIYTVKIKNQHRSKRFLLGSFGNYSFEVIDEALRQNGYEMKRLHLSQEQQHCDWNDENMIGIVVNQMQMRKMRRSQMNRDHVASSLSSSSSTSFSHYVWSLWRRITCSAPADETKNIYASTESAQPSMDNNSQVTAKAEQDEYVQAAVGGHWFSIGKVFAQSGPSQEDDLNREAPSSVLHCKQTMDEHKNHYRQISGTLSDATFSCSTPHNEHNIESQQPASSEQVQLVEETDMITQPFPTGDDSATTMTSHDSSRNSSIKNRKYFCWFNHDSNLKNPVPFQSSSDVHSFLRRLSDERYIMAWKVYKIK